MGRSCWGAMVWCYSVCEKFLAPKAYIQKNESIHEPKICPCQVIQDEKCNVYMFLLHFL